MGFPDEFLFNDRETRITFIDAIRQANPDVLFVHGLNDYHPDHRIAGQIAIDARIPASVRLVETAFPPCDKIPHIFIMDNIGGYEFEPEVYVDITDTFGIKWEMLTKHVSQDTHLQASYGMNYVESMERLSKSRGEEFNVKYAEAFRSIKTYPITGGHYLLP